MMDAAYEIVAVGVSHRTAPVAVRERLAFTSGELGAAHDTVGARALEALVLSTCNRVELYGVFPRGVDGAAVLVELLGEMRGIDRTTLRSVVYVHAGAAAVRHLHAVAAGLDSLVMGETEILTQLRTALSVARARGTLGLVLDRLGASAVNGARWAHRRHGSTQTNSVAVQAIREVERIGSSAGIRGGHGIREIRGSTVAVLGAGQLASRVCALLRDAGAGRVIVANRTESKAAALAARHDGEAWPWERRYEALSVADVALLCTSATERVVDIEALAAARRATGNRPLVCVDLALPRAIDARAAALAGITLIDLDMLQRARVGGDDVTLAIALEHSVDIAVARFDAWRHARAVVYATRAARGGAA